jgi:hypothetical protein
MYAKLSQGTTVSHFKDMWEAKIPLKIKIFSWQLALDKLPTGSQIATRQSLLMGHVICVALQRMPHISSLAALLPSLPGVLRQLLGRNWRPANFAQFHAILSSFSGLSRRLLLVLFLAQSWALWLIRNKLTIERKVINHSADVLKL